MKTTGLVYLTVVFVVSFLTAYSSGSNSSTGNINNVPGTLQHAEGAILITGAGIKGSLAFADVKLFALNTSFPAFYDKSSPISTAITNQYAQSAELMFPQNIEPYILTIGGTQAIDLNTGKQPVISNLITIITKDMRTVNRPIHHATPLTTLAFHMARGNSTTETGPDIFVQNFLSAATEVSRAFAIDQNHAINILNSPLVFGNATDTLAKQEEAVYHRASLEAFAAKVYQGSLLKGDGLHATYYNDTTFTQKALERTDVNINFNWGSGSPGAAVNTDNFSARWTGLVEAAYSEVYTFYTSADDGVRLWVDGQLLIDQWHDQTKAEYSATVQLTVGQKYPIIVEYYENGWQAVAKLHWSSASQPKSVVTKNYLYSVSNPALLDNVTADTIIERLALDLQSDGIIDNAVNGTIIGGIDRAIFAQDPLELYISNTGYRVKDIINLMKDERILIGTDNGPTVLVSTSMLDSQSTSSTETSGPTSTSPNTDPAPVTPGLNTLRPAAASDPVPDIVALAATLNGDGIVNLENNNTGAFGAATINVGNAGPITVSADTGGASLPVSIALCETNPATGVCINPTVPTLGTVTTSIAAGATPTFAFFVTGTATVPFDSANNRIFVRFKDSASVTRGSTSVSVRTFGAAATTTPLYYEDFSNTGYSTPHTLNKSQVKNKFGWSYLTQADGGNVHLVNDPFPPSQGGRGTVLKIDFKEGNYAVKKTAPGYEPGATGMQAGIWRTSGIDELFYAYDIAFPDDFIFNFSMYNMAAHGGGFFASNSPSDYGKVIYGGPMFWGGNSKSNALAAKYGCGRNQTNVDGNITLYQYHSLDYQVNGWSGVPYKKGVWNRIEVQLKVNTPHTASNGIARMWLNGQLIYERTDRKWRNGVKPTLQWQEVMLVFYEGGNSPCWMAPRNQSLYLDNLIISENPITH